ncbi:unnamed protein product [Arctogadus glacialis]
MKSGWQKLKERLEKEERAKRGRQLVTQFFANKEGGGQDPPTATTTGSHFGEGEAGPSSCHVPPNTNVEVQKDRTGTSSAEEPSPSSDHDEDNRTSTSSADDSATQRSAVRQTLRYSQRAVGEHEGPGGVGRVADDVAPGEDPVALRIRGGGGLARKGDGLGGTFVSMFVH